MANKGLKEENTMLDFEIAGIKVYVDLAKPNKNIIAYIPLTLDFGPKPIEVGLFYNDQNKNVSTMFGNGFKFSKSYEITSGISGGYMVINPDGSQNLFTYDSYIAEGVLYKDIYGNKLEDLTYEDFSQFRLIDKYNNLIIFEDDSYNEISLINVLGKYDYSFTNNPNMISIYNYQNVRLILNNTSTNVDTYEYKENNELKYTGYITYSDNKITRIRINKNNIDVKDILIDYTNGITIKDNITKQILNIIQNNDILTINEGYYQNNTNYFLKTTIVNYVNDYKTKVTNVDLEDQTNNMITTYYFDKNSLLEQVIDSDYNVVSCSFNNDIKKLNYKIEAIYQRLDDLSSPIELDQGSFDYFTNSLPFEQISVPEDDEEYLEYMYQNSDNGSIYFYNNVPGIGSDSYGIALWVKNISGTGTLTIELTLGTRKDTILLDETDIPSTYYKMLYLGATSYDSFDKVEFELIITGNLIIEFGRLEIFNINYKTNYEYEDTNLISSISGECGIYGQYNSKNILDVSYGTNNQTLGMVYDNENRLIKEITPQNIITEYSYNNDNDITTVTLKDNNTIVWEENYNYTNKELTSFNNKYNDVSYFGYTNHNMTSKSDFMNNYMNYWYDNFDDIIEIHRQNLVDFLDIDYDSNRFVDNVDTPAQNKYKYTYDNKRRITSIKYNNQIFESYTYDNNNLLTSIIRFNDTYTFIYDNLKRIDEIKLNNICKYKFYYDNKSRLIDVKKKIGNNLVSIKNYIYDDLDNLEKIDYLDYELDLIYHQNKLAYRNYNKNGNKIYIEEIGIENSISKNHMNLDCYIKNTSNLIGTSFFYGYNKIYGKKIEKECFTVVNGNDPFSKYQNIYCINTQTGNKIIGYKGGDFQSSQTKALSIGMWVYTNGLTDTTPIFDILEENNLLSKRVICYINNNKIAIRIKNINGNNQFVLETTNYIDAYHWHFIAFSYEYSQLYGHIYRLNLDGRYHEFESLDSNYNIGQINQANYHIGYSNDTAYISQLSGYVAALYISNGNVVTESDIDTYYRLSKEFIIRECDEEAINYSSVIEYKNELLNNYDIIPLHSNVISLKGKRPVKYKYITGGQFVFDNFNYNKNINNKCYSIGNHLTYNYNISSSGTVFIKCFLNMVTGKAYLIDNSVENGSSVSIYLMNGTLHFEFKNNSAASIILVNTNLNFTLNSWHLVGVSYKVTTSKIYYRVMLDDNEYHSNMDAIPTMSQMLTTFGKTGTGNYSFDGSIEMAAIKVGYIENLDEYNNIKTNLLYYSSINKYDKYNHLIKKEILKNQTSIVKNDYSYYKDRIISEDITYGNSTKTRSYGYNANNMITTITDSFFGNHSYTYDSLNRVTSDNNTSYSYDMDGNIIQVGNKTYSYDNLKRLSSVGYNTIYYQQSGNVYLPTSYKNQRFYFEGKRLIEVRMTDYDEMISVSYNYNESGLMIEREEYHHYLDDDYEITYTTKLYYDEKDRLITEVGDLGRYDYLYDENGIYGFIFNLNNRYYYIKDILGVIIGVVNEAGMLMGKYDYDAYGNIISSTVTMSNHIIYKGYYYDYQAELYYLKSRFYKPEWHRFLTSDSFEYLDYYDLNGINLYSYCNNNPVMNADPDGHFTILGLLIGMTIGVAFAGTASLIGDLANNGKMFDGDINYMRNMGIGGVIGLLSLGISPLLGIAFYFGYVIRDLYTSLTNDADLRFDEQNKVIYNSYRTISYDEKLKYIRDNDIAKKMNKTEFEILLEWDLHNLAYYLDIFGLLRERSKDLNIG